MLSYQRMNLASQFPGLSLFGARARGPARVRTVKNGDWRDPRTEKKHSGSRTECYLAPVSPAAGRWAFMVLLTGAAKW